jgi:hypothetical protein
VTKEIPEASAPIIYGLALNTPAHVVNRLATILTRYRRRIGSRWRLCDPTKQAVLTCAYLEGGHTYRALGEGNGVPKSTCRTLVQEGVKVLQLATRNGADVSDTLKYFSERIPATFIYAGIDVERAGLFSGVRGSQIAGRFTMIPTNPFPRTSEWTSLIATIENALRLQHHKAQTLVDLAGYLHQRTNGMIGSLSRLIRGAALDAILTGKEKITKKLLDAVELDHAAQNQTRRPNNANKA